MTEAEFIETWETMDEQEINTVQDCPCDAADMIIRDPHHLPTGSIFAWCPTCGCTYSVLVIPH